MLTRRFGDRAAVDGVNLSIAAGSVVGIVGAPGAGKSTLLRLIAGLTPPSAGDARVHGVSVAEHPQAVAAMVGYLPQEDVLDPGFTCDEFLRFHAACFGVPQADHAQLVADLLALVDLLPYREALVDDLTPGMRRRLGLARALVNNPLVLLLDEPLRGLDPRARVEFRGLIEDLRSAGCIVLLTAECVADVGDVASTIVRMEAGVVAAVDEPAGMAGADERTIEVLFLGDATAAEAIARGVRGVRDVRHDAQTGVFGFRRRMLVTFASSYADAAILLRSLMHSSVQVIRFAATVIESVDP